ncbi:outer membrane beta-barrel protein [Dyella sp.]|jgi:opacity protein-like surface antigen|uniref:outer membrane beta-barrel protein n=1 Tax=Dyella sp. TaxID=1869338 RepID=UPI002BD26D23|nr:outer membrane beta-barrel protein [Dyella sp.]HTC27892.1 outer membrane beta-barrel protein [Dyella sp.]
MPVSITLARAVGLALAVLPGAVWASQFEYSIYGSIEHSDNITLSDSNPISQNVFSPGINFTYAQQGSVFQANVTGTLQYNDYLGHQFSDQTQTELAAQANWTVLPKRLDFTVEDYAGVEPVDSLASNAPNNQQQTNVLSLGPTLHLQFGDIMRAQLELHYLNSYASKVQDFNSSRGMAAFRLYRDLSPTDTLSLNIESQRVRFNNSVASELVDGADDTFATPNYTRNQIYGEYASTLAHFDADLLLGWSRINFNGAPDDSKPLARATLGWQFNPSNALSVTGEYEFSDAAQDMLLQPGQSIVNALSENPTDFLDNPGGGISTGNLVIDSEVYLEKSLQATYTYHTERLQFSISPTYDKLEYLNNSTFDQATRGGTISVDYHLRPRTTLTGFVNVERQTYESLSRTDTTYRYGVDLGHQLTPHWTWHVSYIRQLRSSTAIAQSYHENEIYFSVVFKR